MDQAFKVELSTSLKRVDTKQIGDFVGRTDDWWLYYDESSLVVTHIIWSYLFLFLRSPPLLDKLTQTDTYPTPTRNEMMPHDYLKSTQ